MAQDKPEVPEEEDFADPDSDEKKPGIVPDIVRRAVLTGVGALFMTEESARKMLGEMKMPKEALGFLLSQADKTRTEVARVVTAEVRRFLESETLRRELWKVLTSVTLEVNASIQLKPSGEPQIKTRLRQKKKAPEPEREPPEPTPDELDDEEGK